MVIGAAAGGSSVFSGGTGLTGGSVLTSGFSIGVVSIVGGVIPLSFKILSRNLPKAFFCLWTILVSPSLIVSLRRFFCTRSSIAASLVGNVFLSLNGSLPPDSLKLMPDRVIHLSGAICKTCSSALVYAGPGSFL